MQRLFLQRGLIALLTLAGLYLVSGYVLPIAAPFFFAGLLALIAEPLVRSMQQRLKLRRSIASGIGVTVVLTLSVLLLLALCALLVRQLRTLAGILPDLESATVSGLDALEQWLLSLMQKAPDGIRPVLIHGLEGIFSNGSALLDGLTERMLNLATSLLKALPDSALGLGTWILASFMLSIRLPRIRSFLGSRLPSLWRERYAPHLRVLKNTVWGWVVAQAKLVGITFCILSAGFLLLQISHPLLWAGLTCLVDILPILGTGTVLIPWSAICFLQGETLRGVGLLGIYVAAWLTRSVLEPKLIGKQLGLDPLVTLMAMYTGYQLWGLLGMILSPLLAVTVIQVYATAKQA
jgi:sporulation integral membrane protein YtvI